MRFALIFLGVTVVWFLLGHAATTFNGWFLRKKLMKLYGLDQDGTDRKIVIENQQSGIETNVSTADLLWNSLTWPRSVFYAVVGYKKLKARFEMQRMENISSNEEVIPNDHGRH